MLSDVVSNMKNNLQTVIHGCIIGNNLNICGGQITQWSMWPPSQRNEEAVYVGWFLGQGPGRRARCRYVWITYNLESLCVCVSLLVYAWEISGKISKKLIAHFSPGQDADCMGRDRRCLLDTYCTFWILNYTNVLPSPITIIIVIFTVARFLLWPSPSPPLKTCHNHYRNLTYSILPEWPTHCWFTCVVQLLD